MSSGASSEDLVRYLAYQVIADDASGYNAYEHFPKKLKALGLELKKILGARPVATKAKPKPKARAK